MVFIFEVEVLIWMNLVLIEIETEIESSIVLLLIHWGSIFSEH